MTRHSFLLPFLVAAALPAAGQTAQTPLAGDMNGDGRLTIEDVTLLVQVVMEFPADDVAEYVDLGLTSRTLWATTNVGASCPEDYGGYYSWGGVSTRSGYSWKNYEWMKEGKQSWEYCAKYTIADGRTDASWYAASDQFVGDGLTELEALDDAAAVNCGASWCMPTAEQMSELRSECTWTWTKRNTTNGYEVEGPNHNRIFLPAAGMRLASLTDGASLGYYWTRSLSTTASDKAVQLEFGRNHIVQADYDRYVGMAIRAVRRAGSASR